MNEKKPFTVACIPAFEEEATIARVILSTRKHVDKVLVCDDGSVDMTGEIAKECGAMVVRHERNLGKGNSLKTLLGTAVKLDADVAVLIDGDGQHNPDEIPGLIEPILQSKADVVVGSRYLNGRPNEAPLYRRSGLRVLNFLHKNVSKLSVTDAECGFRALSRKAMSAVCFFEHGGYGADVEMLSLAKKNGLTIVEVPVAIKYKGLKRTSKRTPLAHGGEIVANLLRLVMEERPMMYLGLPGVVLLSLGMLAALYTVIDFNFNSVKVLSLHAMMAALGATVAGLLLVVTSFMLYALGRVNKRLNDLGNLRSYRNNDEHAE